MKQIVAILFAMLLPSCISQTSGRVNQANDDQNNGKTTRIVIMIRSFIRAIGSNIGTLPSVSGSALAQFTDGGFSETAQSYPGRMTTNWQISVSCLNGKVVGASQTEPVIVPGTEPATGSPIYMTATAYKDVALVEVKNDRAHIAIRTSAIPPESSKPLFWSIRSRSCDRIWHQLDATLACDQNDEIRFVNRTYKVSGFPSHTFAINYVKDGAIVTDSREISQGPFSNLWSCGGGDLNINYISSDSLHTVSVNGNEGFMRH